MNCRCVFGVQGKAWRRGMLFYSGSYNIPCAAGVNYTLISVIHHTSEDLIVTHFITALPIRLGRSLRIPRVSGIVNDPLANRTRRKTVPAIWLGIFGPSDCPSLSPSIPATKVMDRIPEV